MNYPIAHKIDVQMKAIPFRSISQIQKWCDRKSPRTVVPTTPTAQFDPSHLSRHQKRAIQPACFTTAMHTNRRATVHRHGDAVRSTKNERNLFQPVGYCWLCDRILKMMSDCGRAGIFTTLWKAMQDRFKRKNSRRTI